MPFGKPKGFLLFGRKTGLRRNREKHDETSLPITLITGQVWLAGFSEEVSWLNEIRGG
jgi:hypothetical protein